MSNISGLRIGIVGCGAISHYHGRAAQESDLGIRFPACCDLREEVVRQWAHTYGCDSWYTDYEEMVHKEELDVILLATWPNQHREQIEQCLAMGVKNLLCEKALCLKGQEALEIYEMVGKAGAFLMEGFMYRHHPATRKIEELLLGGKHGTIDSIRAHFSHFEAETATVDDTSRNWRQRKECGGGVPYDFACYCVNTCNHFAPSLPRRVFASGSISPKYDTITRLYALIEYEGGQVGLVESSNGAASSQELQVICAHGRLTLPVSWTIMDDVVIDECSATGWVAYEHAEHRIAQADAYQLQMENLAAVVHEGSEPRLPLEESVLNTFTLEALVNSLLENHPVDVAIPDAIREATNARNEE